MSEKIWFYSGICRQCWSHWACGVQSLEIQYHLLKVGLNAIWSLDEACNGVPWAWARGQSSTPENSRWGQCYYELLITKLPGLCHPRYWDLRPLPIIVVSFLGITQRRKFKTKTQPLCLYFSNILRWAQTRILINISCMNLQVWSAHESQGYRCCK